LVVIYLTWGKDTANAIFNGSLEDAALVKLVINLIQKLIFFVFIPLFVFIKYFGYSIADFGVGFKNGQGRWRSHLNPVVA